MARTFIKILGAVLCLLLLLVLFNLFQPATLRVETSIPYSDMLDMANAGQLHDAVITGHDLHGQLTDGRQFQTYLPDDPSLARDLATKHVRVVVRPADPDDPLLRAAIGWVPYLLLLGIYTYWLRRIANAITALQTGAPRARTEPPASP